MTNSPRPDLKMILLLALISSALWIGFGPVQLGGPVSYVIISGNSMEPDIQMGDLVVARRQTSYQVNQQVVYNHPQVGYVFHRIIDQYKDKFTLKGDNNDWLDSFQPTDEEIIGKYWFVIPGAGKLIRILREPVYFVSFVIGIALIIAILFFFPKEDRVGTKKGSKRRMKKSNKPGSGADNRLDLLLCLGLVALAAIILGVVAFSRPLTITIADDIFYQHYGDFIYSASDAGGIYDRTGVETGDPIYPLLTCKMNMVYSYEVKSLDFTSAEREGINGTIRLTAMVSDADGWNRSFLLIPEYIFKGSTITAPSTLDICKLLEIVEDKELKTGAVIRSYTLAIKPEVFISGTINGNPFKDDFSPDIEFILAENVLRVPDQDTGFGLEQESMIAQTREEPNQLLIFGKGVEVETLRWIALVGFGLSFFCAVYPAWSLYSELKDSTESRIKVQNQPLLVDIKAGTLKTKGLTVVEVDSFQGLRKMAERYGAMIMHEVSGLAHRYSIQDGSTLYLYTMESSQEPEIDDGAEG